MTEMLDRVQEAISEACDWALPPHLTEKCARAAIAAMREPTEGMKLAGSMDPGSGGPGEGYETEVWRAMIDEVLR